MFDSEFIERISLMPDDELLEAVIHKHAEYTEPALELLKAEMHERGLKETSLKISEEEAAQPLLTPEDFIPLENGFSATDLIVVQAILQEHKIPFIIPRPHLSSMLPVEETASAFFAVNVHKARIEEAKKALHEHFDPQGDAYQLKHTHPRERLRAFSFHDVRFSDSEMEETVDVTFPEGEKTAILALINKLLIEIDQVEKDLGRPIFFYDNLEDINAILTGTMDADFTRTDLMTILEVLQIYSDRADFPQILDEVIVSLLGFFSAR
jgi:hypothetical protein